MKNLPYLILLLTLGTALCAITPEEIIRRMEENEEYDTAYAEGRMITTDKHGTISRSFLSWSMGEEDALIEFTSKGEEGQKILRTGDEIYLYFPDAAEILRIQGSAMRDSVMDSDFSYEDMTGDKGLLNDYDAELLGEEKSDGIDSYKVRLTAKRRSVPYHSQLLWIDKERFVGLKSHKFASSGRLLKELEVLEFENRKEKIIPVRMVMRDTMKKNSSTEFIIDTLDLEVSIDPDRFSLEELSW
jgi:outer membrane lipoprotein-sorting protein